MPKSVVIIGSGVGGLVAAIYARLRGRDVLLLEADDRLGGKAAGRQVGGYRLDPGPSIVILPRILRSAFLDAGRRADDYLRLRRLDPITHVRLHGGSTLDLPADRDTCLQRLREIDAHDADALEDLLVKLDRVAPHVDRSIFRHPYDSPWQLVDPHLMAMAAQFDVRATYKELVDRRFRSPLVRSFFYGFPSYSGQTYHSKAAGALLIPYFMLQEGVYYPEGGVAAIPEAYARLALELGVEVRLGRKVQSLEATHGIIRAACLADGERITADAFISNVDRTTTRSWLGIPPEGQPSLSYFTVHLGLRPPSADVARTLRHHNLFVPADFERGFRALYEDRRFPDPPIVYLNVTSGIDPQVAPPDCANLFAVVSTPADEPGLEWDLQARVYRQRVLGALEDFGIEIGEADIEMEVVQTPCTFAERHGNYRGSLYGLDESLRPFGGLFPPGNRDPQYRNLAYCGGSVQPGAGLPMVALSGKFAAHTVRD